VGPRRRRDSAAAATLTRLQLRLLGLPAESRAAATATPPRCRARRCPVEIPRRQRLMPRGPPRRLAGGAWAESTVAVSHPRWARALAHHDARLEHAGLSAGAQLSPSRLTGSPSPSRPPRRPQGSVCWAPPSPGRVSRVKACGPPVGLSGSGAAGAGASESLHSSPLRAHFKYSCHRGDRDRDRDRHAALADGL
jgi:hypothetical protein